MDLSKASHNTLTRKQISTAYNLVRRFTIEEDGGGYDTRLKITWYAFICIRRKSNDAYGPKYF